MRDYNVTLHHPHPPGFPVFIGAAKLVRLIATSDFRALQTITVLASILAFPAVFLLARELRMRFETSLVAGVVFAFFPNIWFYGGTAFSDVPSIVLAVFAVVLLLRGRESTRDYYLGTALLALAIGIRPQNFLIGLFPGLVAMRRRPWRESVVAFFIGLTIVGVAYGGAMYATGTVEGYRASIREHGDYISRVDSFLNPARPALWRMAIWFFLKQYQSPVMSAIVSMFVIVSIAGAVRTRDRSIAWAVLIFAPFAIMAWLMLDRYSVSRFSIGYAPLFALLAADGIRRISRDHTQREFILGGLVAAAFAIWAFPAFDEVRGTVAPTIRAVEAAERQVDPRRDQLYAGYSMTPFLDYFAPSLPYTRMLDDRGVPLSPVTRPLLIAEVTDTQPQGTWFTRERGRLWSITRHHYFEVVLGPLRNVAEFGAGWSPAEHGGNDEWRWMGSRSFTRLAPAPAPDTLLRIDFIAPLEIVRDHARLTVVLNGRIIESHLITRQYITLDYHVSPASAPNLLELRVDRTLHGRSLKVRFLSWGAG